MQRLADVEEEENDPIAFLEALKLDLGQDESTSSRQRR